jgi:hypothetical protein
MRFGRWARLAVVGVTLAAVAVPSYLLVAHDDPLNNSVGLLGIPGAIPSVSAPTSAKPTHSASPSQPKKPAKPANPKRQPACAKATSHAESGSGTSEKNDPVTIRICVDDITPAIGQKVTVTLVADDPDAVLVDEECGWGIMWGDEPLVGSLCRDFLRTGTPSPFVEEPGHIERWARHVYASAGVFTIRGSAWSGEYDGYKNRYSSRAEAKLTIRVG